MDTLSTLASRRNASATSQTPHDLASLRARMADLERGQRIKRLRREKAQRLGRRVTQQDMADHVGVKLRAAQEWEYGGGIDDDHLPALLEFLEASPSQLLGAPDLMAAVDGGDRLDRIERKLDELLRRTSRSPQEPATEPPTEERAPAPPDEPIPPTHPPDEADTGEAQTG